MEREHAEAAPQAAEPALTGRGMAAHPILALQQAAGNRAVVQMLARDGRAPGDTAPVDDVDIAAGGRARTNRLYGRQCEPYANATGARLVQAETWLRVQTAVGVFMAAEPAIGDVLAEWRKYLTGGGGLSRHDLTHQRRRPDRARLPARQPPRAGGGRDLPPRLVAVLDLAAATRRAAAS